MCFEDAGATTCLLNLQETEDLLDVGVNAHLLCTKRYYNLFPRSTTDSRLSEAEVLHCILLYVAACHAKAVRPAC